MQVTLPGCQLWIQCKWRHLVAKIGTYASVAIYLAGEITQVLDAIPWVHCASGNVCLRNSLNIARGTATPTDPEYIDSVS